MSGANILVPSFGNWEMAGDISYTVVFDKARAMKDANHLDGSILENNCFYQNSDLTGASSQRSDRCSMNDGHSWRQNTDLNYETGTSSSRRSSWQIEGGTSASRRSSWQIEGGTSASRRSTLQQTAHHILAESQYAASNVSPAESQRSLSLSHSRRISHSMRKNNMHKPSGKGMLPTGDPSVDLCQSYQQKLCKKQLSPSPARDGKAFRSYSLERGILPKFGDWDATDLTSGEDFSVLFNKAREERKSRKPCDGNLQLKGRPKIDEDLYKPSLSNKSSSGIWSLLHCCRHTSVA